MTDLVKRNNLKNMMGLFVVMMEEIIPLHLLLNNTTYSNTQKVNVPKNMSANVLKF